MLLSNIAGCLRILGIPDIDFFLELEGPPLIYLKESHFFLTSRL